MKTTENISLAGYAFVVETDAYEALEEYLNDIRSSFSGDASADEIVSDIEERIAELLRERCINGMVVDITMVQDIKRRIGNPKELAQEDIEPEFTSDDRHTETQGKKQEKKTWKNRRLYRNMDERMFGGVCSGLGTYFGVDKVIFRIIFLIFFFLGFIGWYDGPFVLFSFLAYICLWIAMPAARTAEQKREMKGRPLNLNNYKTKDFDFEKEVKEAAESPVGRTTQRAGGAFLGILMLLIGLTGLLGGIFIPALPSIIGNEYMQEILEWGPLHEDELLESSIVTSTTFWGLVLVMLGIFCIWFIYNGIMLLFDMKSPSWRPGLILFIAWILSIFVLAGWVIKTVADALPLIV